MDRAQSCPMNVRKIVQQVAVVKGCGIFNNAKEMLHCHISSVFNVLKFSLA